MRKVAKLFRVYFRPASTSKTGISAMLPPGNDYLLDHSIFIYLMDKQGKFAEVFGKDTTHQKIIEKILQLEVGGMNDK